MHYALPYQLPRGGEAIMPSPTYQLSRGARPGLETDCAASGRRNPRISQTDNDVDNESFLSSFFHVNCPHR